MWVIRFSPYGMFGTNSFLAVSDKKNAVLIDAPGNNTEIIETLSRENLTLRYILLTHAHCDHIEGLTELREKTGAEVVIHKNDRNALNNSYYNLTEFFGLPSVNYGGSVKEVSDGDIIRLDGTEIKVIHTPGHTPGSIMYMMEKCVFSGDTIFEGSIGRTDMPGGDISVMRESLRKIAKIAAEHGDYTMYPGHGEITTFKHELEYNPYLK